LGLHLREHPERKFLWIVDRNTSLSQFFARYLDVCQAEDCQAAEWQLFGVAAAMEARFGGSGLQAAARAVVVTARDADANEGRRPQAGSEMSRDPG
jgi:2-polyprenyl-6-methoxyphenol hydroxylase-like FAD-dependent oxidoreductase